MASAASIEVVLRARDEATAVVKQAMSGMVQTATQAQASIARAATATTANAPGQFTQWSATAGAQAQQQAERARAAQLEAQRLMAASQQRMAGLQAAAERFGSAMRTVAQTTGTVGRALVGMSGPSVLSMGALIAAWNQFGNILEQDISRIVAFNQAMRSTDAGPLLGALQAANAELEKLGELSARVARGGFGGLVARGQGGAQWLMEALGLSTKPEDLARRAEEQARAVLPVLEGITQKGIDAARLQIEQQARRIDVQAALGAGQVDVAREIRQQIEELAQQQRDLARSKLEAEQILRRPAVVTDATLARERADLRKFDEQADLEKRQRADEYNQMETAAADRRLQNTLKQIEGEQALSAARIQSAQRVAEEEAKRTGHLTEEHAAQMRGVARLRDAELAAINATAAARLAAARGPDREEQVLAARREQATALLNLERETAAQIAQIRDQFRAAQQAADDKADAEARDRAAKRAEQAKGVRDLVVSLGGTPLGERKDPEQKLSERERLRLLAEAQSIEKEVALLDIQARAADRQAEADRIRRGTPEDMAKRLEARITDETGGTAFSDAVKGAAGELTRGFENATTNAKKLTDEVKQLGVALKELQTQPGFAAKLSQDLADTLQFLGARQP